MVVLINDGNISIQKAALGPWGTNTYVVICRETLESLVIDGPGEPEAVLRMLKGTKPRYILLTHHHPDHIGALPELRAQLGVPLAAYPADSPDPGVTPDIILNNGDTLALGGLTVKVLHTPGHTPGSLCFHIGNYLLAGDTLFPGGPGKTRTPGDFREILNSITGKILTLPENTRILPGHGGDTTVGEAAQEYRDFAARPHAADICGDVLWGSA